MTSEAGVPPNSAGRASEKAGFRIARLRYPALRSGPAAGSIEVSAGGETKVKASVMVG